ncbi:MAG: glycoside hydrolase family 3 protein [Deinococcota bacterium]
MQAFQHMMIDIQAHELSADERAFLREYQPKGICLFRRNITSNDQCTALTAELRDLCGPDVIIATDQEGGSVVRALNVLYSPGNMALGAVDDVSVTQDVAAITAGGLRQLGINVNLAPVADVNNNPANPVISDRSFGSRSADVSRHVAAFVRGMQGEGVAATLKHFPGHGDTATDSHHDLPRLERSLAELEATELPPFKAGIAAGAACVLSFHGILPALDPDMPATLSKAAMTDLLRDQLGFNGVSISDALEMAAIKRRYPAAEAASLALQAGIDMPESNAHATSGANSVKQHLATLTGVQQAEQEGRFDPDMLAASAKRLSHLATTYPAKPEPVTRPVEDVILIARAAHDAVTITGNLPQLAIKQPLVLVAADHQVGGSASDVIETPARALMHDLVARGFTVHPLWYQPDETASQESVLTSLAAQTDASILFISASRVRLNTSEVRLAQQIAERTQQTEQAALHVALWNPYSTLDIALPAIISFGFNEAALEHVVDILQGAPARGKLPIVL